jgi:adenylate cyclase
MLRTWDRLSSLGIREQSTGERRRIRLTNQGAIIAMASCAVFITGYAIAGSRYLVPLLANALTMAMLGLALFLNHRGSRLLARSVLLLPINLAVLLACMLLGARVGYHYYFFLFAMTSFLVFEDHAPLKWAFASLSVTCFLVVVLMAPLDGPLAVPIEIGRPLGGLSAVAVIGTMVLIVHLFTRDTTSAEARLATEHARSEKLLLNILPSAISTRLKDQGDAIADGFAEVTVLFADLVGFTELSQKMSPEELVRMLNRIFSAFDDLAQNLGIEKIKTIGDCYMVAAGLPEPRADHVHVMARMALRMREALDAINAEHGYSLRVRIGLHTGPVVAGVIGKRKFIYDLWGDTVNTASRMESSGDERRIHVTKAVWEKLGDAFVTSARGAIKVKGKGEMETYWLDGER